MEAVEPWTKKIVVFEKYDELLERVLQIALEAVERPKGTDDDLKIFASRIAKLCLELEELEIPSDQISRVATALRDFASQNKWPKRSIHEAMRQRLLRTANTILCGEYRQ